MLNLTTDEVRALANGEVDPATQEKAERLLSPVPDVIPGQTTIDEQLEERHAA